MSNPVASLGIFATLRMTNHSCLFRDAFMASLTVIPPLTRRATRDDFGPGHYETGHVRTLPVSGSKFSTFRVRHFPAAGGKHLEPPAPPTDACDRL
jgi:hypothetical protein